MEITISKKRILVLFVLVTILILNQIILTMHKTQLKKQLKNEEIKTLFVEKYTTSHLTSTKKSNIKVIKAIFIVI